MIPDLPKENVVKCQKCAKPLINFINLMMGENPEIHQLEINCPFCKYSNTGIQIMGAPVYGPIGADQSNSPTMIYDVDFDKTTRKHILQLRTS